MSALVRLSKDMAISRRKTYLILIRDKSGCFRTGWASFTSLRPELGAGEEGTRGGR